MTPVVSGHLPCTATLSMSRHVSTLNYLRLADTCLTRTRTVIYWLSEPAITDSVNRCRFFGGHFSRKMLAHTLTSDRQFAQYFPCCHLVTTSNISYRLRDEPHDIGKSTLTPIGYVRFTTSHRKSHVFCFQPAMSKKRTILSLDQ